MPSENDSGDVREAVGVFDTADALQAAIDELQTSGFDRADISLMTSEHVVEEKLGHRYKKVSEMEDDANVPRTFYVAPESIGEAQGALVGGLFYVGAVGAAGLILASGGTMAAAILAATAAGGAGGVIGAVLGKLIGDRHAQTLQEQLDRGGLLLWVRAWDEDHEKRALDIMTRHSGHDVHVHGSPAG
ncbi:MULTISPECIES: hypothetical protein [Methylosinus]|uniref:General stress protein 17M-like domain-containing protein n=1 Tax=Methylosinus trichosporium (strain ATCC 35070 / NCIMB 11131 / UNIQEM 75 / OB3b) TaxID=595536 RepID=A0A2D2CWX7_METT3|nr:MULTISPECIES: hypothetical protein [Methylosinus]ATQ67248.1 hypothetical protein CQW49_04560 [Methylosinus trichosporium OB3b]OBS52567.1 hypothetical protein A8B73_10300 [Methylosinus sp. 3S-1]